MDKADIIKELEVNHIAYQTRNILVIHPADRSTEFLTNIYSGINCTVIRSNVTKSYLASKITEASQVIILGHGTPEGLLGNVYNPMSSGLLIDSSLAKLLASRTYPGIYIWCHADKFIDKFSIPSLFHTGMFISETEEAMIENVKYLSGEITKNNNDFAYAVKKTLLKQDISHSLNFVDSVKAYYVAAVGNYHLLKVFEYNRSRFYGNTKLKLQK